MINQQIFVPVTDELIYNHPEDIQGPLIPYFAGMECQNWLSIEINPDDSKGMAVTKAAKKSDRSHLKLAYSS